MNKPSEERLHQLVHDAEHESVTADVLTNKKASPIDPRVHDRPLYSYLSSSEQPHFVFHSDRRTPHFYGPNAPESLSRTLPYKVMHLITDSRWIMIAGNRNGDQVRKIALRDISATNFEAEGRFSQQWSNNRFVFETEGMYAEVPISNRFDEEDLDALSARLYSRFDAVPGEVPLDPDVAGYTVQGVDRIRPDRETLRALLDQLPPEAEDDADELIEQTSNPETLVTELNALIEEYEEADRSIGDIVADASSVEMLRRDIETPLEKVERKTWDGIEDAKATIRDADPKEVGDWSLAVSRSMLPVARAVPYSTSLSMLALLGAGSAVGAYASSHKSSILGKLDPEELAIHAMAMADRGSDLEHIDGEAVGALMGAFYYLGGTMAPEEYAKWVLEADPRAILDGAEAGAAYAAHSEDGKRWHGALAGSGLGLAFGYSGSNTEDSNTAFRESLDEDLYKEYLETMARNGLQLPT